MTERGFTLIEVMVAMALTTLIATLAYTSLNSATVASEQTIAEAQRLREIDRALRLLEKDLAQAVARNITDRYGNAENPLVGGEQDMAFTRTGWPNPAEDPRSQLQRVSWEFYDEQLSRSHSAQLDGYDWEDNKRALLLSGVSTLRINYLGKQASGLDRNADAWRSQWGQGGSNVSLPVAVQIIIELEDWGEIRRLFTLPPGG